MHSNYSLHSINNHQSIEVSENGYYYLVNGKNFDCHHRQAMLPHSPSNFQTACRVFDANPYCNMLLQNQQNANQSQNQNWDYQCDSGNNQRRINNKKSHVMCNKKHSPPPMVHHCANKTRSSVNCNNNNNNNNKLQSNIYRKQQMASVTSEQQPCLQSLKRSSKKPSEDKHYHHYYSYYYNPHLDLISGRDTSYENPIELMASIKNNPYTDNILTSNGQMVHTIKKPLLSTKFRSAGGLDTNDNNRNGQPHIIKETLANNNVFNKYGDENWLKPITIDEVDNGSPGDYLNGFDIYDKINMPPASNTKSQPKRKLRTRSESETQGRSAEVNNDYPFMIYPAPNNNTEISEYSAVVGPQQPLLPIKAKLPATPSNIIGAAKKKQSPPAPRVLLYNNQSPRSSRTTIHSVRNEGRRGHTRIIPSTIKNNRTPHSQQRAKEQKRDTVEHTVNTWNSLTPESQRTADKNARATITKWKGPDGAGDADSCYNNNDTESSDDDDLENLDNVNNGNGSDASGDTTDSEDGYRLHAFKMTHHLERVAITQSCLSAQSSEMSMENPPSLLMPSLFPHVPPYLAFSSNTEKGPYVPPELYRIMKWKVSSVMPKVVRCILTNSGMRLLKKTNDWMGVWGKHMKSPCFKTIRPHQKINHLPGSFKIGRKDSCWRNLQKQMAMHGRKDFGFMPRTYIIPNDINLLRKNWPKYAQRNVKWIIKPPASARGTGIRVVNRWAQIPKRRPLIVQKYIERPLLINGSKFDLRLYVLVTSMNPLRVYMYHNGLARFASIKYSDKAETLNDRCMHLTNYSINKFSSQYSKNEDVNACHGHKWTIKSLWTYLANRGVRTDFLWAALRNLVLRTLLAGENSINNMIKLNVESKYSCFELFGFDILLDSDLVPWLLEVNISPSLHSDLPLDAHVKAPLVQAVLNTALYNVPPKLPIEKQLEIAAKMSLPIAPICFDKRLYVNYLSREEKIKHNIFTRKTMEERDDYISAILDHLTPDDVRCLIVAEDEYARSAPLERIFPTTETYKYLKYTDSPRYYNRLLDAWETRYAQNRAVGIDILRDYCEEQYHLRVPPPPAKKTIKYRTRALAITRPGGLALTRIPKTMMKWKKRRLLMRPKYCESKPQSGEDNSSATD